MPTAASTPSPSRRRIVAPYRSIDAQATQACAADIGQLLSLVAR